MLFHPPTAKSSCSELSIAPFLINIVVYTVLMEWKLHCRWLTRPRIL